MSVLVTSLLIGAGVLLGRVIAKVGDRDNNKPPRDESDGDGEGEGEGEGAGARNRDDEDHRDARAPRRENATKKEAAVPNASAAQRLERFPCRLGDVLLRNSGDEAWLAGAVLLGEGQDVVAVLFVSPDAGGDRVVLARPPPSDELLWLTPITGISAIAGEPPAVLEVAGERFERKRRLPLAAERIGTGAPDVGREVIFAEYTGLGDDRLIVLAGSAAEGRRDATWAWRGPVLLPGSYDVLPGKED